MVEQSECFAECVHGRGDMEAAAAALAAMLAADVGAGAGRSGKDDAAACCSPRLIIVPQSSLWRSLYAPL